MTHSLVLSVICAVAVFACDVSALQNVIERTDASALTGLTVDLDYTLYKGSYDANTKLNVWLGYVRCFFRY